MKDVYVVYRWRYVLIVYPIFLCSGLLSHYAINIFSEPVPMSALGVFLYAGMVLGILLLFVSTPLIKQADIEVSRTGVVGPVRKEIFKTEREHLAIDKINLSKSKCRFFRAYLRTYDGKKLLVAAPVLGMSQVRNLFLRIRNTQVS